MMKKTNLLYIALGAICLILLAYFYWNKKDEKFDWTQTFDKIQESPYGTFAIHELLKKHYDDYNLYAIEEDLNVFLTDSLGTGNNYVLIADDAYYNQSDIDSLMAFVARGNNAFLSTSYMPFALLNEMIDSACGVYEMHYDSIIYISLDCEFSGNNQQHEIERLDQWKRIAQNWGYYDSMECAPIVPLGYMNDSLLNLFELPYGNGSFYFHSTPLVLTNFYVLDSAYIAYADELFSLMNEGDIYWDAYSQLGYKDDTKKNRPSPLKFILSQPALRWAWYILVAGAILFMLFYMKRRQSVIPVVEKASNTTVDFIESIGELYFQQAKHLKLVQHKKSLLLSYIRNHYNLNTNEINEHFIRHLSVKSGLQYEIVNDLFKFIKRLEFIREVSAAQLIDLHQKLEEFYLKSK